MNINEETKQKLEKTIERIYKALEYNDQDYVKELITDLTEFAYFSGFKDAELDSQPVKNNKKHTNRKYTEFSPGSLEERIGNFLLKLGVPAHIKGYKYLVEAIAITHENPAIIAKVTKVIYPNIAKKFNTSSSRVERAIRHAIEMIWKRGNPEALSPILGHPIHRENSKPANSTFIYQAAKYLINNPEESESSPDSAEQTLS